MRIDNLQIKLIKEIFQYITSLKREKVDLDLSSLTYMPTYGQCPGFFKLREIETKKKQSNLMFNLKNFLSISKLSSLSMKGNALLKNYKYDFLFVSWANEKDFSSNGEYFDRYFRINSKKKKILWLLIYIGKNIPKKIDKNILIIHNKKVFFKYNLFFLIKYFLSIFIKNKFNYKNIYHQMNQESCFALKINNFMKKILSETKISKLYLPYESQTFQNKIISTSRNYNKKIKIYGYDHMISALPINNIYKSSSPDFLLVHSNTHKNMYTKFFKWPKNKIIKIPSLRFFKKGRKFFDQAIFLPHNILLKNELINNFEFFLSYISTKKIKPFNVKIHPLQKNVKEHKLFKNEINNLMKRYTKSFSTLSKKSYAVFFGATSAVVEALENGSNVIHIVSNATLESYSKKFWPYINVNRISKNVFEYTLRKKNQCLNLTNRQVNLNFSDLRQKV